MHTVTVQVPDLLYHRLRQQAAQTNRTLESAVLEVLIGAVPVSDELPADLQAALSPLATLDDAALLDAARSRLPAESAEELASLHGKQGREGLSTSEKEELARLVRQYERHMLVRAKAAALLRQRGHDISSLAHSP